MKVITILVNTTNKFEDVFINIILSILILLLLTKFTHLLRLVLLKVVNKVMVFVDGISFGWRRVIYGDRRIVNISSSIGIFLGTIIEKKFPGYG